MAETFKNASGVLVHGSPAPSAFAALVGADFRGQVYVMELRPSLVGARTTAAAMLAAGYSTIVISDNMAAYCMWKGLVQACVVTRFEAGEKDLVCPTGALGVALCAERHGLPVVALPGEVPGTAAFREGVAYFMGHRVAGEGVSTLEPPTDRVPCRLIRLAE